MGKGLPFYLSGFASTADIVGGGTSAANMESVSYCHGPRGYKLGASNIGPDWTKLTLFRFEYERPIG